MKNVAGPTIKDRSEIRAKNRIVIYLTEELIEALNVESEQYEMSRNAYVRALIENRKN